MPLITCEINLILTWSSTFIITDTTGVGTFAITDTKVIDILSTQDNAKLLQKLKSGFKRTLNWSKYQSKVSIEGENKFVDYFFNPSFQGVNRLFVLSSENENGRTAHTGYYLPKVKIKNYNVKIDGRNFFDQSINYSTKTYENIKKLAADRRDDYKAGSLLDYPYFLVNYEMIAIDLSKEQYPDADITAIQQVNFTSNLDSAGNTTMLFILEEVKETILYVSQVTVRIL